MPPHSHVINFLAGTYINRVAHLRKDPAWLEAAIADNNSLFVPVWRSRNLVQRHVDDDTVSAVLLHQRHELYDLLPLQREPSQLTFLGQYREQACFAWGLGDDVSPSLIESVEFQDLRSIASTLSHDEAGLLAYARAMITWRHRHRFCGHCGSVTVAIEGGHVMRCTNTACATQAFPRIDPAIIVLVTDSTGERALLGRQAHWPPGRYSTIAGFVEPGESLEDAVRREVLEETGVEVAHISYHSSQPWPFPSSLMLGFMAQASTTDIVTSDNELEDAQWFTRADIAAGKCSLPSAISISSCLIDAWLQLATSN